MALNRLVLTLFVAASLVLPPAVSPDAYAGSKTHAKQTSAKQTSVKQTTLRKASVKQASSKLRKTKYYRSAPKVEQFSALVVNADTGQVLYEKNAGGTRYPASLTKMMTLYLTFDAIKKGRLTLDTDLPVSVKAASQPQTNIALEPGENISVRDAIESVVVRSANDSAMVLAEGVGRTEFNFALMMTQKARELGMKDTVFRNPNGLPDNAQHTTAYDMAKLAIALRRDFPDYYPFFKLTSFTYNGITYPGHNRVMERYSGADGVKTGYIRASGFNLVTSVKRSNYNIVGVIMGGTSANSRDNQMIAMLDRTFAQLGGSEKNVAGVPGNRTDAEPVMPDTVQEQQIGTGG